MDFMKGPEAKDIYITKKIKKMVSDWMSEEAFASLLGLTRMTIRDRLFRGGWKYTELSKICVIFETSIPELESGRISEMKHKPKSEKSLENR